MAAKISSAAAVALPLRGCPPLTLTKLGQKPFWQEKSLFHDDWSMARLRPNSVSTGVTDTQFDWVLQSPQSFAHAGIDERAM